MVTAASSCNKMAVTGADAITCYTINANPLLQQQISFLPNERNRERSQEGMLSAACSKVTIFWRSRFDPGLTESVIEIVLSTDRLG